MSTMHGFTLIREEHIAELDTRGRLWRHDATGAELLSLENDDENKVFGINFRTLPSDSTGVAHILEHAALGGSRKYPVKEPFVELLKGSLQTFVNAFTYPDKTCYPVASQNVQDFYNLIDVYLDAVFYPSLTRHTFEQEGWHYELENIDAPLIYKGVVFNEMKGTYASPDNVLSRSTQQAVFPDNPYSVDSGGDPQHIPDLTFEQFKDFHASYYHPSNARIFFYGDDDPEERLRILDAYLRDFTARPVDSLPALQQPLSEPSRLVRHYASSDAAAGGKTSFVTVSWLLPETTNVETVLSLMILTHILVGMPASPLRKALIDSGLGEDLAGDELVDELRQMYFSTGLKGIAAENVDVVEALVIDTLRNLAENGIDKETVQAALNTVEFQLRENNTGSFPRGIAVMLRALGTWLYDGDPFAPLAFDTPLAAIKARLDRGERFFEELIRRMLLENPHKVTLVLQPDPELDARKQAREEERLAQTRAAMSTAELEAIIANAAELQRLQVTPDPPEALATIPTLTLSDLDRQVKTIPLAVVEHNGARVLYHDLFTNGILYLDLGLDLHALPQDLLAFVPLFGRALLETGTEHEDFVQLSQRIGRNTGGIRSQLFTSLIPGAGTGAAWLFLRAKAMPAQAAELLAILRDVLSTARLDNQERFRQIVLEEKAGQEARLVPAGHQVVNTRLRAQFDEAGWAADEMGGVDYLFSLRRLAQRVETDWPSVLASLEQIRRSLVNRTSMIFNVTIDEAHWNEFRPALDEFVAALPADQAPVATWSPPPRPPFEGLCLPAPVNYVAKGANLYRLGYELHGSEAVITKYLGTNWLWERIRVRGGAYGGFCAFDHRSGVFTFLSYRDPNLLDTLKVYDETGRHLREVEISEAALAQAIIGAIGAMDAYQLPDAKGYTSMQRYLVGDTDAARQKRRDEILATTVADFRSFGEVLGRVAEQGSVVVLGSQSGLEAAKAEHGEQVEVVPVL